MNLRRAVVARQHTPFSNQLNPPRHDYYKHTLVECTSAMHVVKGAASTVGLRQIQLHGTGGNRWYEYVPTEDHQRNDERRSHQP